MFRFALCACLLVTVARADNVFYVGHSLVNWDMPQILQHLAQEAKTPHAHQIQLIIGSPLQWNWKNSHQTHGDGVDGRKVLAQEKFDALVITTASPIQRHLKWSEPAKYGGLFYDLARQQNPQCQLYIYQTWPTLNAEEWEQDSWSGELRADVSGLEGMAREMTKAHSPQRPVRIIPCGLALARLQGAIEKRQVPGLTRLRDVFADDIHMNQVGNYFVACVHYATLYRRSPVGLTGKIPGRYGGFLVEVPPAQAKALQEIAWQTVRDYPQSGVGKR